MRARARQARALSSGPASPGSSVVAAVSSGRASVELVLAGEKQTQREVRLKGFGIGCDGAAIEGGRVVQTILRVGNVAGIEERARIGGMSG